MTTSATSLDDALLNAAIAARLEGRTQDAARQAAALVAANPSWARAQTALGMAQLELCIYGPAEMSFRAALTMDPTESEAAHGLGLTLLQDDRLTEALLWLRAAAADQPDVGAYHRGVGKAQMFGGDMQAARESFRRAFELDPSLFDTLANLIELTPMQGEAATDLWRQLDAVLETAPPKAQMQLSFARGKARQDQGKYELAFADYARGAALADSWQPYDIEAAEQRMLRLEQAFDKPLLNRLAGLGDSTERPIFIIGMPRCGSTLTEQILCSHPKVDGGGELSILPNLLDGTTGPRGEQFPAWTPAMTEGDCRTLANAYLSRLPAGIPGRTRITDKQLLNSLYVGMIHLILPRAKIIHVRRDPRDQILSCFTAGLGSMEENGYAYDLEKLGRYWRAHERLMAHWRRTLPPGVMFELPYEAMVNQPEVWIRRLLEHCELEWREACLSPQTNKRPVRTASLTQVRQPINSRGIGRWRHYAAQLEPAFQAMGLEPEQAVA